MKLNGVEITQEVIDRFESKIFVVTEGTYVGCYETTCCKNKDGYSVTSIKDKQIILHRLMYQIHHPEEDIDDKHICHRCDNPGCVNIAHLFSGTHQDNINDKVNKGRQAKGSNVGRSKLTEENVVEIINLTLSGYFTSYYEIAKQYNITESSVGSIINQKFWSHITKDFDMVKVKLLLDNRGANKGSNSTNAAFNEDQVRDIRIRLKSGEFQQSIADFYNVARTAIQRISAGKSYQDVV